MIPRETVVPPSACPGFEELMAFAHGRLPLDELALIAEHLPYCSACETSVHQLHATDTILTYLRNDPQPLEPREEAACARLEDRARRIADQSMAMTMATVPAGESSTVHENPPLPAAFGAYQLLGQLGQGGMGVVYKARQERLKRLVALKMVRAGVYASFEERARFQREGEAIARVQHPHVVRIHEFGEHNGQLYFSMELLENGTLASKLNDRPLAEREAAELVRTLAQAVEAAHQQGVVHRDLKPSNVLFASDGTAKIGDFGLAKMLDGDSSDTRSDAILGTPDYMAPEQARGESRRIGRAADIYALGAILYEALTGQPPFRTESRYLTLEMVRTCEPEPPSRKRARLSRDLEAICLTCLAKEPARRYLSAAALAEDLDRWLRGEPTRARPLSRAARLGRTVRRHPRTAVIFALLVVLAGTASLAWHHYHPERPLRAIERRLERGESIVLVGETGKPAWHALPIGGEATRMSLNEDGTFTVHSWSTALVELLRDPRYDSYRLSAEVRHRKGHNTTQVGLYVFDRSFSVSQGTAHSLVRWTFDDWHDLRDRFAAFQRRVAQGLIKGNPRQPPPRGNYIRLHSDIFLDKKQPPDAGDSSRGSWSFGSSLASSGIEPAITTSKWGWRQLALEVTPHDIRGYWEGKLACQSSSTDFMETVEPSLRRYNQRHSNSPFTGKNIGKFAPRGRLGLYVHDSSASFRRVVFEPLGEAE